VFDPTEEELAAQMQLEKQERRRKAYEKRQTMESCLTLVRSEYYHQKDRIEGFVAEHPTQDKNTLTNKIVARMMLQCKSAVNQEQITFLQGFKLDHFSLNVSGKPEYQELVTIDWEDLRHVPTPEDDDDIIDAEGELEDGEEPQAPKKRPVNVGMSTEERMINNEIDDISEELNIEAKALQQSS
jgi:hypothetical protein